MLLHCRVYLWSSNFFMKLLKADFDMYTSLTLTANVSTIHFTDSTFANRTWFRIMPMTVRSDHIWYSVNLRYRQCCCGCGFDQSAEQDVDTVSVPWLSQLICSKGTSNIQMRRSKRFQQVASAIFYSGCLACNLTMLYQQGPLRPCHSCSVH